MDVVGRGDIWLVTLDPTVGSEIRKTRPALIVSPADLNDHLRTVIIAPLTSGARPARFRVPVAFDGKPGLILLDQIRTVAKERLIRRLGLIEDPLLDRTLKVLRAVFSF